jgi:hypothetical protein
MLLNIDGGVEVNARLEVSKTGVGGAGIKTIKCDTTRVGGFAGSFPVT